MHNIFRVPVDNQHFKDTIEIGKPVDEVIQFLSGEDRAKLQRISKDGFVRYWGSIPGEANSRNFQKLAEGDELLCYRSGNYISLCKIAFTTINKNLAKHSWGETEKGSTWELIYFFSEVSIIRIDSKIINKEFGFADGPVMGFSSIADEKVKSFLIKNGSVLDLIKRIAVNQNLESKISEEIAKLKINSPFEAQFYLVDLGNQLQYDTYVPTTDAGRSAFGKKLDELITIRRQELDQLIPKIVYDPISNIDAIWFKGNIPQVFFEVIHSSGMDQAIARLKAAQEYYQQSKAKIIGSKETETEFEKSKRLYFSKSTQINQIGYKPYDDLITTHSETLHFQKLVNEFLD